MSEFMIRQGDVLVRKIDKLPPALFPAEPEAGRFVLAHGEMTGHHHSILLSNRVAMFREDGSGSGLFMSITGGPVYLEHQEHAAIELPPGDFKVIRQRTFSAGMSRRVED